MNLIDKDALVTEIERRIKNINNDVKIGAIESLTVSKALNSLISFIKTLEVKESKLPNPRFPHLNNIVDKVFGIGNLESWEYEEAEQLVLLAKEELLKDLKAKEVDLEKEIKDYLCKQPIVARSHKTDFRLVPSPEKIAKDFFKLGLKAQKGE